MVKILQLKTTLRHPEDHAKSEYENAVAYLEIIKDVVRNNRHDDILYANSLSMLRYARERKRVTSIRLSIIGKKNPREKKKN